MSQHSLHVPVNPVRFVTAASLFDGHDAAINIMRRLLQAQGAEVIHLGHDRSVEDVVTAAMQEDVQGVAISSYQGGHVEYFTYLAERLKERGAQHVKIYGGGGGVIVPEEIKKLDALGVHIFSPQDGQRLGLAAMINELISECDTDLSGSSVDKTELLAGSNHSLARAITVLEAQADPVLSNWARNVAATRSVPVLGITGTGGSGKSSITDELIRRFRTDSQDKLRIAVLSIDPTRQRGGGALLGDRIRMNSIDPDVVFFRSLATRESGHQLPIAIDDIISACKAAGFDLVIIETPGMGQGDTAIVAHANVSLYVMTPEYGAASQLEKINMLDFADVVAINKFERRGAEDARRDVARQLVRNRGALGTPWEEMPVFGTSAARFNDDGISALYETLRRLLVKNGLTDFKGVLPLVTGHTSTELSSILPRGRERYLAEIADTIRAYHTVTQQQSATARRLQQLDETRGLLDHRSESVAAEVVARLRTEIARDLAPDVRAQLEKWPDVRLSYEGDKHIFRVRDKELHTPLFRTTLSGTRISRVALPRDDEHGELVRFLRSENLPGYFPFTAGVFPFKRTEEAPARMFAGEGDPARTNRRFHLLSAGQPATRLSTAFDSVTLYGRDPSSQPDVLGKVGTSGVSVATLDDMRDLYTGFDLCSPATSVSMTINGPAPTILAMFLNTAIDQRLLAFKTDNGRMPNADESNLIRSEAVSTVRGTVQADILKEDQGQNTCIFSTEFSLR
jgi:methylmalonyl-CoA mutase